MPRYIVTLTDVEVQELKTMVQKGEKDIVLNMHKYF